MYIPSVSVIIPTFNRAHCVSDAIDSVLNQSIQDFELIIIDDGSTDTTSDVIAAYGKRLLYISQPNGGVSAARNAGIRAARGEWLAFLDSDDIWEPDKLKIQIEGIKAYPKAIAHIVDAMIEIDGGLEISTFQMSGQHETFSSQPYRERPLCDVIATPYFPSCWLVKKAAIEKAGYFKQGMNLHEDRELLSRVSLLGPFIISCYLGTRMRRRTANEAALSELYQTARLQHFNNLIYMYSNLKKEDKLSEAERKYVCRMLSGIRHEKAMYQKGRYEWRNAFKSTYESVVDDFGPRAAGRAFLSWAGLFEPARNLFAGKRKSSQIRRSELDKSTPR